MSFEKPSTNSPVEPDKTPVPEVKTTPESSWEALKDGEIPELSSNIPTNPWEVLGIEPGASEEEVVSAFRRRAQERSPYRHSNNSDLANDWLQATIEAKNSILSLRTKTPIPNSHPEKAPFNYEKGMEELKNRERTAKNIRRRSTRGVRNAIKAGVAMAAIGLGGKGLDNLSDQRAEQAFNQTTEKLQKTVELTNPGVFDYIDSIQDGSFLVDFGKKTYNLSRENMTKLSTESQSRFVNKEKFDAEAWLEQNGRLIHETGSWIKAIPKTPDQMKRERETKMDTKENPERNG